MGASSFVQHLVSGNCLEVRLEWEFQVALRVDVHSSGAEGAKMRLLRVSVEETTLLVSSQGFQENDTSG